MSVTISLRVDLSVKEEIESLGYTPSEYLRQALRSRLKRDKAVSALAWLKENRLSGVAVPVAEMIRNERDSR